jgi:hypothetical protein
MIQRNKGTGYGSLWSCHKDRTGSISEVKIVGSDIRLLEFKSYHLFGV